MDEKDDLPLSLDLLSAVPIRGGLLHLLIQPLLQLLKRSAAMRDLILLVPAHLGVRLAFILEACVPA
jgi:hypothetical protein